MNCVHEETTKKLKPKTLISSDGDKSCDTTEHFRKSPMLTLLAGISSDCNKKICVAVINLCGIFPLKYDF